MTDFAGRFLDSSLILLLSAAVAVAAIVVIWLSRTPRTVHRHVCRLGRNPARIAVTRARGPVTISIRQMDANHVWIAVDGPAEAMISDAASSDRPLQPSA